MTTLERVYAGRRGSNGEAIVRIIERGDARALPLRLDLFNHSPTGFEWGYGGSGPAQLALALIADALGDDAIAIRLHQAYKWRAIATLPRMRPWRLTQLEVLQVAADLTFPIERGQPGSAR
jgi:hypothetical protein